jgi:hypothetical protein
VVGEPLYGLRVVYALMTLSNINQSLLHLNFYERQEIRVLDYGIEMTKVHLHCGQSAVS